MRNLNRLKVLVLAGIASLMLFSNHAVAQQSESKAEIKADVMPEFPGGMDGLITYMSENIKYPKEAKESGTEGKVFVKFVVEKSGKVNDVEVKRGLSNELDEVAVNAVKKMPKWKPGMKDDKPVAVEMVLPVMFALPKK